MNLCIKFSCLMLFLLLTTQGISQMCFRSTAQDSCPLHFVLEVQRGFLVSSSSQENHEKTYGITAGVLYRTNQKNAFGLSINNTINNRFRDSRMSIMPRWNYFISDKIELNLAAGPLWGFSEESNKGIRIQSNVGHGNFIGLFTNVDIIKDPDNKTNVNLELGGQFQGLASAITIGIVVIGVILISFLTIESI